MLEYETKLIARLVLRQKGKFFWPCSVINFHNLQSFLGLFGSLLSEPTESSDWYWFVVKK